MNKAKALLFGVLMTAGIALAGLETGTYISDLVATNPTGSDLRNTADDHLRLIKSTLKNTFPNINGAVTATQANLNIVTGTSTTSTELGYVHGVTSAIQTQIAALAPATSGSFTGTLTGMTGSVTGTIYYKTAGHLVTLYTPLNILGASNANTMTLTGVPTSLMPSNVSSFPFYVVFYGLFNNGNSTPTTGIASALTTSSINFGLGLDNGTLGSSFGKGLAGGWSITYPIMG